MTDDTAKSKRGPSDAADYSSTKAPETQKGAEERDQQPRDYRLWPGGRNAAPVDPGMGSLDRDTSHSGGVSPGVDVEEAPPTDPVTQK